MTNQPGHPAMSAECLSAFLGTRRTVRVTLTLSGPSSATRVVTADMPGVLANAIVSAMLARPLAVAQAMTGPRVGRGTGTAGLALHAPASRVLGATSVNMWTDFDASPESAAYVHALTASRGAPVRSTATIGPDMRPDAVWASLPRDVVSRPMPIAERRRKAYHAAVAADPGIRTRRSADRRDRYRAARAARLASGEPAGR